MLTSTTIKKGFIIQEYAEGQIFISSMYEKSGRTQVQAIRIFCSKSGLVSWCERRTLWIFFSLPVRLCTRPTVRMLSDVVISPNLSNAMRIYHVETKVFIQFELETLKPSAFVLADGNLYLVIDIQILFRSFRRLLGNHALLLLVTFLGRQDFLISLFP